MLFETLLSWISVTWNSAVCKAEKCFKADCQSRIHAALSNCLSGEKLFRTTLRKEEARIRCASTGIGEVAFSVAASVDSISVVAVGDFSSAVVQRSKTSATLA